MQKGVTEVPFTGHSSSFYQITPKTVQRPIAGILETIKNKWTYGYTTLLPLASLQLLKTLHQLYNIHAQSNVHVSKR